MRAEVKPKNIAIQVTIAVVTFVLGWRIANSSFPPALYVLTWFCVATIAVTAGAWLKARR